MQTGSRKTSTIIESLSRSDDLSILEKMNLNIGGKTVAKLKDRDGPMASSKCNPAISNIIPLEDLTVMFMAHYGTRWRLAKTFSSRATHLGGCFLKIKMANLHLQGTGLRTAVSHLQS